MANEHAYSMADLVALIRSEIKEPVARVFSGAGAGAGVGTLDNFIDAGAMACSALTLCYEVTEVEVPTPAGTFVIAPSTYQFISIESVEYLDTGTPDINYGLQRIHPQAFGHVVSNTQGRPLYYWVHNTSLLPIVYITPAFTAGMVTATDEIQIKGYAWAPEYAASGVVGTEYLPFELQIVPLYYALSCVYARLGKHQLSALNMQKFIDECNKWRILTHPLATSVDPYDISRIPDVTVQQ